MEPEEVFANPVSGSAYRWPTKALACILTALVIAFVIGLFFNRDTLNLPTLLLFIGAAGAMSVSCYFITTGQTTVDSNGIRQDWISGKTYTWDDVKRARVLRLPMATRLVINTGRPPFKAVYGGTPELEKAFDEITRMRSGKAPAGR